MANFFQKAVAAAFRQSASKKRPNGAIVAGRTEEEAAKPVNGNHNFYGDGIDHASQYRDAASNRALIENTLRKAWDPNKKAFRVTCADEQF